MKKREGGREGGRERRRGGGEGERVSELGSYVVCGLEASKNVQ